MRTVSIRSVNRPSAPDGKAEAQVMRLRMTGGVEGGAELHVRQDVTPDFMLYAQRARTLRR